jgi:hypothetical protein
MTRHHATPLSVKLIVGLWLALAAFRLFGLISGATTGAGASKLLGQAVSASMLLYGALALARLSRWPVLLYPALSALNLLSLHLEHFAWREHYPMLGPFVFILPPLIFLAFTLPHWRKMNWSVIGGPYRPAEDQAEIFT